MSDARNEMRNCDKLLDENKLTYANAQEESRYLRRLKSIKVMRHTKMKRETNTGTTRRSELAMRMTTAQSIHFNIKCNLLNDSHDR